MAIRLAKRALPPGLPGLLYLTDPVRSPNILKTASHLPHGSGIIYRHFGAADRLTTAAQLRALCWQRRLYFMIGNDAELAQRTQADGVHWAESQMHESKYWTGKFKIMTSAAHSIYAIKRAKKLNLDAVLVSTVFASNSPSASPHLGAVRFRHLSRNAAMPVYGLGGITAQNAGHISSVSGLASISGIEKAFGA